jgi:hypothetical protein
MKIEKVSVVNIGSSYINIRLEPAYSFELRNEVAIKLMREIEMALRETAFYTSDD